eukprot:GHVO01039021.1.p1 GENE.GHVO01039021.1~~GHVO01039021.1.p1  ORF type:complete len:711 (+),score=93.42 GHVO01039021.1:25-2133(+)
MKTLPLKSTEMVGIGADVAAALEHSFGIERTGEVAHFIQEIDNLRRDISRINLQDCSLHGVRSTTLRYLKLMSALEARVPFIGPKRGSGIFRWSDSFRKIVWSSSNGVAFERACVAFNCAALETCIAGAVDRGSNEGVKQAIKFYQLAAARLSQIRDTVVPKIKELADVDLTHSALSMHVSMILAQAQLCFYEKAVRDKLNRSLLSKLACQTSQYFNAALLYAQAMPSSQRDETWVNWFRVQELAFMSAGHYHRALCDAQFALDATKGHGEVVARLCVAMGLCEKAVELAAEKKIRVDLSALLNACKSEQRSREFDNRSVYLEPVPAATDLPPLDLLSAVKATGVHLDSCDSADEVDELAKLEPISYRVQLENYKAKCREKYDQCEERVSSVLDEVRRFLASGGLPFSLDVDNKGSGLPHKLWTRILDLQVRGGQKALIGTVSGLNDKAEAAAELLKQMRADLDEEQIQDEACGAKFAQSWSRTPSRQANAALVASVEQYEANLAVSKAANRHITDKAESVADMANLFTKSREAIEASVPATTGLVGDAKHLQQVRLCLVRLDGCVLHAQQCLSELKREACEDVQSGMKENESDSVSVILCKQEETISRATHAVRVALARAKEAWAIMGNSEVDPRASFLQNLEASARQMQEAFLQVAEGTLFFSNLKDHLKALRKQIDDWLFARREERRDMLANLQRHLAS